MNKATSYQPNAINKTRPPPNRHKKLFDKQGSDTRASIGGTVKSQNSQQSPQKPTTAQINVAENPFNNSPMDQF